MPGSQAWPRLAVAAMVAVGLAGCSDSARFDSNPFASKPQQPAQQEYTGSVSSRPAQTSQVQSQPLPAINQPSTTASGSASGAQGLSAYRPGTTQQTNDVTGSVASRNYTTQSAPQQQAAAQPQQSGGWTWDGGSAVMVGQGETVESIARKYGVPQSALMQVNGITNPNQVKPGQKLVIPRYSATATPAQTAAQPVQQPQPQQIAHTPAQPKTNENVHVVEAGESMLGIARRHHVSVISLAKANNIPSSTVLKIGDRLTIPGKPQQQAALRPTQQQPQLAQPRTVPAQNARMATEEPRNVETVQAQAEPAGSIPSFRWPARGRVIAGFGSKQNGVQNDGINLALPEGAPIKAADDGVVAYAGNELKGYGNLVLVRHSNGYVSAYAHASSLSVKRGDTVKRGQEIAKAGQTGNVTSPQLHFEIRKGSTPVDPAQYLGNGA